MKRHVQYPGVRQWSGDDLVELQGEGLKVQDKYFSQYGDCVVSGCVVNGNSISDGIVNIGGITMPFAGKQDIAEFPVYMVVKISHIERPYLDGESKDVAVEYSAEIATEKPTEGDYMEFNPGSVPLFDKLIIGEGLSEKVEITLSTNQAQPDAALEGKVVHVVYGDNDTPLTWSNGQGPMSIDVPMNMTYRIVYPEIEGYATPEEGEYIALAGNTRVVGVMYNTTVLTISVDSNQSDKSDLNELKIVLSGSMSKELTYSGSPLVLKVPTNKELVITPAQIDGYTAVSPKTITPTTSIGDVSFSYTTERVTISVTADDASSVSGQTLTVTNTADGAVIYTGAASASKTINVPFGITYKVSVNSMFGYRDVADKSFTSGQATRSISMVYEKILVSEIVFDNSIKEPKNISGDVNGDVIKQIRSKIRSCLAKRTGDKKVTICYLDRNSRNSYHDGTSSVLTGAQGDVMVFFPDIYYKYTKIDANKFSYKFALEPLDSSYKKISNFLLGAYEAVIDSNKSYSRSGIESARSVSQSNHKSYARARGTGYQLVDYDMNKIIAWLFYAIYGTRDCQATCGAGVNSYDKINGMTNSLGDRDTDSTNGNTMSVNFLGLENCWGNKYECLDNVVVDYPTMKITDTVTGVVRNVNIPVASNGWRYPNALLAGDDMDIVAADSDGSASTGYCDGQYYGSTTGRVLWRSGYSNTGGGVACANAGGDPSSADTNVGSRLAFRGDITEEPDVAKFKVIPLS